MVVYDQLDWNIQIGATVGLVAGLCLASILGGPPWTLAFGALVCAFFGAILGLVLWLEVADFPAEPIVRRPTSTLGATDDGLRVHRPSPRQ